jgi:hypothetical protein
MTKMVIARASITSPVPYVYETAMPSDTYRAWKQDRAWTNSSFGDRVLTVALPGTPENQSAIRREWKMVQEMIAKSPRLFDAMMMTQRPVTRDVSE